MIIYNMFLLLFYVASVIYIHLQFIDFPCTMLTVIKESTQPIALYKQHEIDLFCVRNILFLREEIHILMGCSIFSCHTDLEPGPVISFGPWTVSRRDTRRRLKSACLAWIIPLHHVLCRKTNMPRGAPGPRRI